MVQFSSVAQSCLTLCNPMDCSMPGFPVLHQLPELAQIYVYQVGDAIQPSHPSSVVPFSSLLQSFPASGSFPVSQFFASGGQSIGASASASVLPKNVQDWFPLGLTDLISLQSKGLSWVFSSSTVQKHQFFSPQISLWSNSHMTTGKTVALTRWTFVCKVQMNRKMVPMNLFAKQIDTDVENKRGHPGGNWGGGMNGRLGLTCTHCWHFV